MLRFSPSRIRTWPKIISLAAILCGLSSAQVVTKNPEIDPQAVSSVWSFSDLDGDQQSDRVRSTAVGPDGLEYRYNIEFEMSTGRNTQPISILSGDAWGLQIASRDVDGDHDMDLVVTGGTPRRPLGIWTNDGDGNFTGAGVQQFSPSVWVDGISFHSVTPRTPDDAADILSDASPVVVSLTRFQALSDTSALLLPQPAADRAKSTVPSGTRPRAPPLA